MQALLCATSASDRPHPCRVCGILLLPCRQDLAFNIVDIKPQNMEDLTEVRAGVLLLLLVPARVRSAPLPAHRTHLYPPAHPQVITCADYHPHHCSVFAYSSSKGLIRLADQRAAALCDQHAKLFEDTEPAVGGRGGLPLLLALALACIGLQAKVHACWATLVTSAAACTALPLSFFPLVSMARLSRLHPPHLPACRARAPSSARSSPPSTTSASRPAAATSCPATT